MNEFSSIARHFLLLIISINILETDQRIIYIGSCPIVIGSICDSTDVKFYLYSRSHPKIPEYVEYKDSGEDNLTASSYDNTLANKIIIHGYNSNMHLNVLQNLKDEYLAARKINVWMVNYPRLVLSPCYPFSVYTIRYVGKCIASFTQRLNSTIMPDSKLNIHIVGFSLGAQVSNYVAHYLPFKLQRITGLDPALPLFYTNLANHRLDSSDAEFVDVIHTNALFQGQVFPCGHVDFYANGGVFQPGCEGEDKYNCYHSRAVEYFSESINSKVGFWGWRCKSFMEFVENKCKMKKPLKLMGAHCDPEQPGIYQVNTASKSPYAKGRNLEDLANTNVENTLSDFMGFINFTFPTNSTLPFNEEDMNDDKIVQRVRR